MSLEMVFLEIVSMVSTINHQKIAWSQQRGQHPMPDASFQVDPLVRRRHESLLLHFRGIE